MRQADLAGVAGGVVRNSKKPSPPPPQSIGTLAMESESFCGARRHTLRTRHVASMAFAMTCAGPFGVEACVRTAGAPACFLGLLLTMTGYVLPQILMTSELSMMPPLNNGGVTAWVARAFGARVGECVGLNMLLYQIVDLATYTTVVTGYAQSGGYEDPADLGDVSYPEDSLVLFELFAALFPVALFSQILQSLSSGSLLLSQILYALFPDSRVLFERSAALFSDSLVLFEQFAALFSDSQFPFEQFAVLFTILQSLSSGSLLNSQLPFVLGVPLALGHASVAWALASGQQPAAISPGGGGPGTEDVNLFLSSLVWLFTGWDSFGNLAEDVADPLHLVKGMLSAAVIALAVYFVCTFGALAVGPGTWQDGYLALAYAKLWAPLGPWICFSAAFSNSLIYTSELAVTSRFLQSLGRSSSDLPRLLPGVLQKELSSGAPAAALLALTLLQSALVFLAFDYLVQCWPYAANPYSLCSFSEIFAAGQPSSYHSAMPHEELTAFLCLQHRHPQGAYAFQLQLLAPRSSEVDQRFAGLEQVLSGWSPGPLDVLRNRMPDVECHSFAELWDLDFEVEVIFWLTPEAASNDKLVAQVDESFAWLVRLAVTPVLLLAIPVLLRLVVAGLVWFAIKDGLWTTSRAIRDFQPDVLLGFSWGGGVVPAPANAYLPVLALWLLSEGRWKGPTLLLAPTVNAMSWAAQQHVDKKKKIKRDIRDIRGKLLLSAQDGFCPASQVAALSAAGCEMHVCDDNHVLLRRQTVVAWLEVLKGCYWCVSLRQPDAERRFQVPGGRAGAWVLAAVKVPVLVLLLVAACGNWPMVLGAAAVNVVLVLWARYA
ncbi:putative polyamine transporter [Symbiodinium microadriaticum]|uniref:Putative polyamine transporter n=1 Tax=Symbiodinium microadriaticum TaxID=2951 RepID=A0A1Q9DEW7_SYMMI|nr:putative polyamine transporter [Symbiodinium microadriaticum]